MINFASALYLGMRHASFSLRPWRQISAGVPAAFDPPENANSIAARVARLQGCEAATMGTSTLHLVWDLFRIDRASRSAIYLDSGAYPILGWGVDLAAARGSPVRTFRHHDAEALRRAIGQDRSKGLRPLVVTDGFCPSCGRVAPLREYLEYAERHGGALIVDDTQALGILGCTPQPGAPYGSGGGGSLQWLALSSPHLIVLCSMAKGFGVPVAVVSGSKQMVTRFESASETRMHCSPPSVAALRAAENALRLNHVQGQQLRAALSGLVARFRAGLAEIALAPDGNMFPVQTISTLGDAETLALHQHLENRGIKTVLHRGRRQNRVRLSFLINADHRPEEIHYAVSSCGQKLSQNFAADEASRQIAM